MIRLTTIEGGLLLVDPEMLTAVVDIPAREEFKLADFTMSAIPARTRVEWQCGDRGGLALVRESAQKIFEMLPKVS